MIIVYSIQWNRNYITRLFPYQMISHTFHIIECDCMVTINIFMSSYIECYNIHKHKHINQSAQIMFLMPV